MFFLFIIYHALAHMFAVCIDEIKINVVDVCDGKATVTLTNSLDEAFDKLSIISSLNITSPPSIASPPKASSEQSTPSRSQQSVSPALSVRSAQSVSLPVVSIPPGKYRQIVFLTRSCLLYMDFFMKIYTE